MADYVIDKYCGKPHFSECLKEKEERSKEYDNDRDEILKAAAKDFLAITEWRKCEDAVELMKKYAEVMEGLDEYDVMWEYAPGETICDYIIEMDREFSSEILSIGFLIGYKTAFDDNQ